MSKFSSGVHYNVPLSGQHFEYFLRVLFKLYESDPLNLGLALDFWCPSQDMTIQVWRDYLLMHYRNEKVINECLFSGPWRDGDSGPFPATQSLLE